MPVEGVNGILNVESAALHAPQVGVANTNPQHILSVGSNLYVSGDSSDVLTVDGNVVCEGVKVGLIEITPSYDLAAVSNVGNVTSNTIQFTNPDTGIVATGNVTVGSTLTVSGFRITAQAEANDDLEAITLAGADTAQAIHITNATDSVSPFTGALQIGTNTGNNGGLGVAGNVHVGQGMYVTSNLEVGTANLFVDSTTSRVGIGKTDPATALDVDGTVTATAFVGELAASWIAGTLAVTSGGTGTTTSTGTGSVVRSIAPTFTGTTTFSGEVDVNNHLNVTGNTFYTKPTSIHVDSNVVAEYTGPHGRGVAPLKKFPEIIFEEGKFDRNDTTNTYVQAGYTVTASSQRIDDKHAANLYEDNFPVTSQNDTWQTEANMYDLNGDATSDYALGGRNGSYTTLELPHKIKLSYIQIQTRNSDDFGSPIHPKQIFVYGSINGSSWTQVGSHLFTSIPTSPVWQKIDINSTTPYNYFALQVTSVLNNEHRTSICQLRYYGYEEDPPAGDTSVDATFKSVLNTPQTTGAQVYVDGSLGETFTNRVTGPTPTGTAATYDSTGKYWELTGALESNVTLEANTFLEGDQPHAVSVWFNSSNLEANVSNTCVFSISDQEKLDSVNLDLQSNTWHNLTYAYQGEGGSRVTYLDGRKVAEDQAEDTFGDYPPFAMTGLSQGGYVLSTNGSITAGSTNASPHYAFDNQINNFFGFGRMDQIGTGTDQTGGPTMPGTVNGSTLPSGYWLKLELPHKLHVNSYNITPRGDLNQPASSPLTWKVYGSNDDSVWTLLHEKTDSTPINPWVSTTNNPGSTFAVSTIGSFKYLALIVLTNAGFAYLNLGELSYYGHRENDLVRLPDPTNVLKYPHIAMTGPAQRGYVASASSSDTDVGGAHTGLGLYQPYEAFDDVSGTEWLNLQNRYSGGDHIGGETTTENSNTWTGDWLQIQIPTKIRLTSTKITRQSGGYGEYRSPRQGVILGSNNGITWNYIHNWSGLVVNDWPDGGVHREFTFTTPSDAYYKYYRLVVEKNQIGNFNNYISIASWQLYGTEENSSVPIQIGGGNIDKVANFRVYDKFVGEDQALEIWDAQKDEFGRAKSSMTLHKGRLGIGTTEPEGRLAVADEPHAPEEFPPRAMTGYETYMEGHGVFRASASSELSDTYRAWDAFNHTGTSDVYDAWLTPQNRYTVNNYIDVDPSVAADINGVYGEWLELKLPYKITLDRLTIKSRAGSPYGQPGGPAAGNVWGSNDGVNWILLTSFTGLTYGGVATTIGVQENVVVNSTTPYSYFRLQPTKRIAASGTDGWVGFSELRYFGTREQGQSVLHDGQLTLTKSLNVPRIGPALDADDTPRRDRLVVEYNTSTNPTFEGAVRDTSGRGNDGVLVGGVSYSGVGKALEFDGNGSDDYITSTIKPSIIGEFIHSFSIWLNFTALEGTYDYPIFIGSVGALNQTSILRTSGGSIGPSFGSGYNLFTNFVPNTNQWYHMVVVYRGGAVNATNVDYYIDGVKQSITGTGTGTLAIDENVLSLGDNPGGGNPLKGSISNFKLYDTALTAEEVKTLYDMGRCDEGHHVVNFSKTRVGIGLGDGEAPRGALDVRGVANFGDNVGIGKTDPSYKFDVRNGSFDEVTTFQVRTQGEIYIARNHNNAPYISTIMSSGRPGINLGNSDRWTIRKFNANLDFDYEGSTKGFLLTTSSGELNFTGQHRTFIKDVPFSQVGELEGLIVSSDQNKYIKMSGGIEAGSNAITTNESLPIVSLSTTTNDKKCFGVISASEDPEERSDAFGSFVTPYEKEKGDTRVYINSVGEGAIWVSNVGGNLEAGDYITTSNVAGYGQKQDGAGLMNYTVAKITMDCDFNPATQPIQQILRSNVIQTYYLGNVHKVKSVPHEFVTTTVAADDAWSNVSVSPSDVTYAEWSNLEANTQNTYTLTYTQTSNVVYDTKYTLTTTANVTESDPWDRVSIDPPDVTYAEYSNLEANTQSSYTLTFTKTTTDEKTPDEWSNLESNVQSLYNKVYYQSVEEEVASDYPGAVAHTRVTDVIENELDEHGQIQWEDHPTETEKAYKIRYLDVSGAQTDEANAVHIAAFVGCTYHCG